MNSHSPPAAVSRRWALVAPLASVAALAVLAVPSPSPAQHAHGDKILLEGAWTRPAPAGRPMAAYMTIRNMGTTDDRLVAARSPAFAAVELHTVEEQDGVMRMIALEAIPVAAGGEAALAPRGMHLMLFGASEAMKTGDSFALELEFEGAGTIEVVVTVEKIGATEKGHDHGGHGDHEGHGDHGGHSSGG